MSDDRDDVLGELRQAMTVTPSPGFEAQVRRQVAQGRSSPPTAWAWAACGAVFVSAIAFAVFNRPNAEPDLTGIPVAAVTLAPERPTLAPAPSVLSSKTGRQTRATRRPSGTDAPAPIARDARLEVMLPGDHLAVFELYVAAARRGDLPQVASGGEAGRHDPEAADAPAVPDAIVIPPLEIPLVVPTVSQTGL